MVRSSGVWTHDWPAGHRTGATAWKANPSGATELARGATETAGGATETARGATGTAGGATEDRRRLPAVAASHVRRSVQDARRVEDLPGCFGRVKGTFGTAEQPIYLHAPHLVVQADRGVSEMFVRFVKPDGKSPSPDFSLDEEDQVSDRLSSRLGGWWRDSHGGVGPPAKGPGACARRYVHVIRMRPGP